jgi:hypothetical protein
VPEIEVHEPVYVADMCAVVVSATVSKDAKEVITAVAEDARNTNVQY